MWWYIKHRVVKYSRRICIFTFVQRAVCLAPQLLWTIFGNPRIGNQVEWFCLFGREVISLHKGQAVDSNLSAIFFVRMCLFGGWKPQNELMCISWLNPMIGLIGSSIPKGLHQSSSQFKLSHKLSRVLSGSTIRAQRFNAIVYHWKMEFDSD